MKNKILKVGITGHRNLKKDCIYYYQKQVHSLLADLQKKHTEIIIYSPLADGADRLIVYEAIKLGIEYIAVLPMTKERYIMDFNNTSAIEFNTLLENAKDITMIPLMNDNTLEQISNHGVHRDMQYEACGYYIADSCEVLVALWDGKSIGLAGGTGEIIKYYIMKQKYILYHLLVSRSKDTNKMMLELMKIDNTS